MKKILLVLIIYLFLSGCNQSNNTIDLELTLLNDSVHCLTGLSFDNNDYFQYLEQEDYRNKSRNIIKYKLENKSSSKYLIVLNNRDFQVLDERNYLGHPMPQNNNISFNIYSKDSVDGRQYQLGHVYDPRNTFHEFKKHLDFNDSIFMDDLRKKQHIKYGYSDKWYANINKNYILINPGETKYFTTVINLPLRSPFDNLKWMTIIDSKKEYMAGIALTNNAEEIIKYLNEDTLLEIKENGYRVFDGVIRSNKIPVKLVAY